MAQQLWKSFLEALAPPRREQQPRRGGVALNRTVGGRPLPRIEAERQPGAEVPELCRGTERL